MLEPVEEKAPPAPPAAVDKARLLALDRQMRSQKSRPDTTSTKQTSGSTTHGFVSLSQTLGAGNPTIRGERESRTCQDCGETQERALVRVASWLEQWEWPAHHCPEREARRAAEAAEQAAAREAWLRHPPEDREAQVRERCRLPWWTPAGLEWLEVEPAYQRAAAALWEHRETWLSGQRPARGLWLYGPTNRRKTCATAGLLFDISHRTERTALMWNFEALLEQLRQRAGGKAPEADLSALSRAEVLLLDDIGTIRPTLFAWETLFEAVNRINDSWGHAGPSQTLYVTSNESPDDLERLFSGLDRPAAGQRIVRRLLQICEAVCVEQNR